MHYLTVFYRMIVRPIRRELLRASLTVGAVALGVAAALAIELAGQAAAGSFRSSLETLAGRADFEVTANGGVRPETLTRLAELPYALKLHPRIEDYGVLADSERTVPLLGIDLVAGLNEADSANPPRNFASDVWIGRDLPYQPGDRFELLAGDSSRWVTVGGLLGENSGDAVVMDLAQAARFLRRETLDRILIETPPGGGSDVWESRLRSALPPETSLGREGAEADENRRLLAGFRWNLRILSYISLAVGGFLIYHTISVSVVRRRVEIGVVRALGASRSGVMLAFLGEAAAFGLLGAAAGIGLGRLLAEGAVHLVGATVRSLYVSSRPAPVELTWTEAGLALALGVAASVVSALLPAREASQVPPSEAMGRARREHEARLRRGRQLGISAALALCAWIAARQDAIAGKPVFGYLAAALLLAASALALPAALWAFARLAAALAEPIFGVEALLASRALAASLRRTSVLAAALSTAVAMLTAVGIMVGSFRETVVLWMGDRVQADFYVRPAAPNGPDRFPTLSPEIPAELHGLPDVAEVEQLRSYPIVYDSLPATLMGAEATLVGNHGVLRFLSGAKPSQILSQLVGRDAAVVSEPFASKHHVHPGGSITLALSGGSRTFRVADIYYDYSGERGTIFLDRATLLKYLPDPSPSNIAVYLKPGVSIAQGRREIEASLAGRRVTVASNRSLREEGIRVFDRTFAITHALEAVAVLVAVMGVSGALLSLVIDRRSEFGLLRFMGTAGSQLRRIILLEAAFLGLIANAAGLVLGFFLSLILIFVINKQSFGWTIQFHWPIALLLTALTIVYSATILAALYPARMAMRLVPIEALHEE
ncbi:MAG TPA: ABC transporter permease [Bryobacteraceae bacterium]|nr:ABC transporter permease [Bryobacteraceae bacterium]